MGIFNRIKKHMNVSRNSMEATTGFETTIIEKERFPHPHITALKTVCGDKWIVHDPFDKSELPRVGAIVPYVEQANGRIDFAIINRSGFEIFRVNGDNVSWVAYYGNGVEKLKW